MEVKGKLQSCTTLAAVLEGIFFKFYGEDNIKNEIGPEYV